MSQQQQKTMSSVDWPANFERRPAAERSRNNNYDVTLARAFDDLEAELERVGIDDFRYSFDANQRQKDGRPYSRANPDDPSFVLRWTMGGDQYAVGCDAYSRLRDNVRTVGLYVREKRKMESRPVTTGESEFANARLPPGDDEAESVVVAAAAPDPHEPRRDGGRGGGGREGGCAAAEGRPPPGQRREHRGVPARCEGRGGAS